MKRRNGLFWGIALLTLGVLFLARRAGWLDVNWHSLVDLWPLLLILAGANLILERRGNPAAFITTVMLAVAVPTTLFGFLSHDRDRNNFSMNWQDDDVDDEESDNGSDRIMITIRTTRTIRTTTTRITKMRTGRKAGSVTRRMVR